MIGHSISSGDVHREIAPQCPIGRGRGALYPENMGAVLCLVNFAGEAIDQRGGFFAAEKPRHPRLSRELATEDLAHNRKPGIVTGGERLGAANGRPIRSGWRGGEKDRAVPIELDQCATDAVKPSDSAESDVVEAGESLGGVRVYARASYPSSHLRRAWD